MSLHPYLNFGGNCREAFERYQEIFGGDLQIMSFGDMPAGGDAPPMPADQVLHAGLRGDGLVLYGSDDPMGYEPPRGVWVNCDLGSVDEGERVFAALADGGQVTMPLGETFWAARFGMCIDRFGIPWMVNVDAAAAG